jgi:hypothetical protein
MELVTLFQRFKNSRTKGSSNQLTLMGKGLGVSECNSIENIHLPKKTAFDNRPTQSPIVTFKHQRHSLISVKSFVDD